ncbi:type II citrate synthase [Vibrio sp. UCD-FRSSP16_10]|uniref:DUF1853 family protein n=1 Tax=unclassified Vibrio TaxID=2614977 RepID=UPI0007FC5C7B|nr:MULTISPECIES: DUF1853 family protein [unclassified Vibrio]OBT08591.1 type II citrate synthase [Vibrio sp. UCD-FRSSP16_30]OBT18121.1 type II citrate synthase [Vibrio sp. UCD-FRSSP16_10]
MPNYTVDSAILTQFARWIATTAPLFCSDNKDRAKDNVIVEQLPFEQIRLDSLSDYDGNSRLGFIYQYLCQKLFEHHPDFSVCETELQLNDNGRTIGELDFILHHGQTKAEHWEVAIKFYLFHEDKWYGPNAIDRLDKKLNHMLNHQLKHTETDTFIQQFPQWQHLLQHLLLQGRLYINPFSETDIPTHCAGQLINSKRVTGFWCYQSQASQIKEKLFQLNKSCWAIGRQDSSAQVTDFKQNIIHCQSESGRFWFIVANNWPNNG